MALQHHFNNIRLYIFKNILSSRFPRPICAANKFPKSRTTVIFARGYPIHGFFQILLLEHQKWVFPGVSRASFRISFNQTDWKCCRGKRISRTGGDSAERERERKVEQTIVFHATWTRTRCHFFRGTVEPGRKCREKLHVSREWNAAT